MVGNRMHHTQYVDVPAKHQSWLSELQSYIATADGPVYVVMEAYYSSIGSVEYDLLIEVTYPDHVMWKGDFADEELAVYDGQVTGVKYETAFFVFSPGTIRVLGHKPFGT